MASLTLDVETDYAEFLHPKNSQIQAYIVGVYGKQHKTTFDITATAKIQSVIDQYTTIVGHNLKFDLSWLDRYGIVFRDYHTFYDTQTAEYILTGQKHSLASLDDLCREHLDGELKLTTVATEYWDKGIPTCDIPREVLAEYCIEDCRLTYMVYQKQLGILPDSMKPLMRNVMEDYKVIQEMEMEGLTFDISRAKQIRTSIEEELSVLYADLYSQYQLGEWFNFGSPLHVSTLLFGGSVVETRRVPDGVYKTGQKAGQVKCKKEECTHHFKRLYNPLAGTENAAGTAWSTGEAILVEIAKKDKHGLLTKLMRIRTLEKELNTYFIGLMKRIKEYNWPDDKIYGRFNTNTTRTGRLSSAQPNLQNLSVGAQFLFVSKYE